MSKIKDFSDETALEILSRSPLNKETISELLEARLKINLIDIIIERRSKEEAEYLNVLQKQIKHRVGTMEYNALGQQLAILKIKKASANQALNNVKREANAVEKEKLYKKLKGWVYDEFGYEAISRFMIENNIQDEGL